MAQTTPELVFSPAGVDELDGGKREFPPTSRRGPEGINTPSGCASTPVGRGAPPRRTLGREPRIKGQLDHVVPVNPVTPKGYACGDLTRRAGPD